MTASRWADSGAGIHRDASLSLLQLLFSDSGAARPQARHKRW